MDSREPTQFTAGMCHRIWVVTLAGLLMLAGCAAGPDTHASSAAGPLTVAAVKPGADWTTYHGDPARTGYLPAGPDPSTPGVAWQTPLDGAVYASPLVVGGQVLAATEGGSLYALDARTGAVRWRTHLADPVPASALPCGNIDPVGITGTPAFDPATGQVYAVTTQAGGVHVLWAVDAATGQVRWQRGVDPPGSTPSAQLQRPALLLSDGMVYVAYGGNFGDCGQYLGRVVGAPVGGTGPLVDFAVPTTREGGIWAPSGPTALPGGDLLVTTGNGEATGGVWDHSDSVLRLSPQLQLKDGFAPAQWAAENSVDADLGSMGPVLLPGGRQALAAGKGGAMYLVDVDALGGVDGQRARAEGCPAYGGGATMPGPDGTAVAYLPCDSGLLQVIVGPGDTLHLGWQAPQRINGSPVVVGTTVWSVQQDGTLTGLGATDGGSRAGVQVGAATRFATPAASGNALFVPTRTGVTGVVIAP